MSEKAIRRLESFFAAHPELTEEEKGKIVENFLDRLERALGNDAHPAHLKIIITGPKRSLFELSIELRQLRKKTGLTQEAVAGKMEWSVSTLVRVESGHVPISFTNLRVLFALYGVSEDDMEPWLQIARKTYRKPRLTQCP